MADKDGKDDAPGEEDLWLPKGKGILRVILSPIATMTNIIRKIIPQDFICPKETKDTIADCCIGILEFIHLVSSEANELCKKEAKKTINGDHVISALKSLGFDEYVHETNMVYQELQNAAKKKENRLIMRNQANVSQEELEREQEILFSLARQKYNAALAFSAPGDDPDRDETDSTDS